MRDKYTLLLVISMKQLAKFRIVKTFNLFMSR